MSAPSRKLRQQFFWSIMFFSIPSGPRTECIPMRICGRRWPSAPIPQALKTIGTRKLLYPSCGFLRMLREKLRQPQVLEAREKRVFAALKEETRKEEALERKSFSSLRLK